jgi:hypothetical protein
MTKYKLSLFEQEINCESWTLKTLSLNESNYNAEIILTDDKGEEYSHTFKKIDYYASESWSDAVIYCTNKLKEFEVL